MPAVKIDFGAKIQDFDGQVLKEDGKELTLGAVAVRALNALFQDEATLSAEDKVKRFAIGLVAVKGEVAEVSVEEAGEIKRCIGKLFTPLVVGRVFALIEDKPPA